MFKCFDLYAEISMKQCLHDIVVCWYNNVIVSFLSHITQGVSKVMGFLMIRDSIIPKLIIGLDYIWICLFLIQVDP